MDATGHGPGGVRAAGWGGEAARWMVRCRTLLESRCGRIGLRFGRHDRAHGAGRFVAPGAGAAARRFDAAAGLACKPTREVGFGASKNGSSAGASVGVWPLARSRAP